MDVIWIIFLFALGACVGSFLNVLIYRLPRAESIVFPGSHCPACGYHIRWYDNIPLLSWLLLRGRCRECGASISPRYPLVEAATAIRFAGLFICYYVLHLRRGAGPFVATWPMFAAHAALLAGLLVCSAVDVEHWIVPLEVCWVVTAIGLVSAAVAPHPWVPSVSPTLCAMGLAAGVGLAAAVILQHYGLIQQSFIDATEREPKRPVSEKKRKKKGKKKPSGKKRKKDRAQRAPRTAREAPPEHADRSAEPPAGIGLLAIALLPLKVVYYAVTGFLFGSILSPQKDTKDVGYTKDHGVNPRKEVLREVIFLAPAIVLAVAAGLLVAKVPAVGRAWARWAGRDAGTWAAPHVNAFCSALFGYLVGGLWIWGLRILGTLAFGREAMGLGDVHLLAAVGAVCGWIIPSIVFFLAAFLAVAWAIGMALRKQREMPYGPWLSAAALVAMLFYDRLTALLAPYTWVLTGRFPAAAGAGN